MAGKSTISISFKLDSDGKGFKDLSKDADGLKKVIAGVVNEAQQLKGNVINFAALASGIDSAQRSINQLQGAMKGLADAYAADEIAGAQLTEVMKQRMGASDAEIQSIKALAAAQQTLGVVGDEVQLSGAQQVSTFLKQKESLEMLMPAMNDLIAQQNGVDATQQDAITIANLMGKAMQGQTSALRRVGITFDEAEEKVLKYGTETERAAMLAQVITNNVGHMNAALAQTDAGKQVQLENKLGDIKEQIGGIVNGALPFVTITSQVLTAASSIATLTAGMKTLVTSLYAGVKAFALSTAAVIKNKVATLAAAAAQKVVAAASKTWAAIQKILNLVLTANPIGLIITAIGALVAGVILAYKNCEGFRNLVNKLWEAIKPLAEIIMNALVAALTWLIDKAKQAWDWLKKILGLGGKKAEVEVDVKQTVTTTSNSETDALKTKYADYSAPSSDGSSTPAAADSTPDVSASNGLIAKLEAQIDDARQRLRDATSEAAIEAINKELEAYESQLDKYNGLGKEVAEAVADGVESAGPLWKDDAATLQDIGNNIEILNSQLQTASLNEAAAINREISLWQQKADAIKNAGKEAEQTGISTGKALTQGWGAIKNIGSSIEGITESLKGNGNAWQSIVGLIDGFIGLYEGIQVIAGIIDLLSAASAAHATTKAVEAGAETAEAATRAATIAPLAASSTAIIVANKLEAASWKELAASAYMAAHAYIPFAGFGIAAGFTTAMLAMTTAAGIPALAEGGVANGPTLALVGEYSGASNNPEVIAPLDKLRGMLNTENSGYSFLKDLRFKIEGRDLVAIIRGENNRSKRTNG